MSWWKPRRMHVTKANAYFLFVALVLTVLLAAFFVEQVSRGMRLSKNASFTEIRPDFGKLLPATAKWTEASVGAIESLDSEIPSYVVAYLDGTTVEVASLHWDNSRGAFLNWSRTGFGAPQGSSFLAPPSVTVVPLGKGLPSMVIVSTAEQDDKDNEAVLIVEGGEIRPAMMSQVLEGQVLPGAGVVSGVYARGSGEAPVMIKDISGDGIADLVLRDQDGVDVARVYEWQDGMFAYSERLSYAMIMSKRLFPEPPAAKK